MLRECVRGVVQIGIGKKGDEIEWRTAGIRNQIYVEPYKKWFKNLVSRVNRSKIQGENVKCFNVAISNIDTFAPFYICNQGDSHSLSPLYKNRDIPFQWMKMKSTSEVKVQTLDSLVQENNIDLCEYNLLHIDTQGTEHFVIEGAKESLNNFDIIVAEISKIKVYDYSMLYEDWENFMSKRGFRFVYFHEVESVQAGDGVFVRKESSLDYIKYVEDLDV